MATHRTGSTPNRNPIAGEVAHDLPATPRQRPSGQSGRVAEELRSKISDLQRSNERIEKALQDLQASSSFSNSQSSARVKLPKELSASVHHLYNEMTLADEPLEWDLTVSFDHVSNKEATAKILRDLKGLPTSTSAETSFTNSLTLRAIRTYFKTLKNQAQRKRRGKQEATTRKQRRRLRMINKAIARKKALVASTTISREVKDMIEPLLTASYMSSDESVIVSEDETEEEMLSLGPASQEKKIVKKCASWRSPEFQGYIDSLDRKIERRLSERAKRMKLPQELGEESMRHAPDDCPQWAKTVFD